LIKYLSIENYPKLTLRFWNRYMFTSKHWTWRKKRNRKTFFKRNSIPKFWLISKHLRKFFWRFSSGFHFLLMFFFFFKPFIVIANFKRLFLSSYNKFNRRIFKSYDFFFFKKFHKINSSFLNSLANYYNNFDIKKFIFSNFVFYFIFLFFFWENLGILI
jgi:hypothetical protein